MKITKTQLTELIKEAVSKQLNEQEDYDTLVSMEIEVYLVEGKLWVSWDNRPDGGASGNDPFKIFCANLKERAHDAFGRAPRGSKGTGPERVQARVSPARSSSAGLREAVRNIERVLRARHRRQRVYAFTMVQGPEDNEPQDRNVIVGWVEDKDGNELESWRIPLQKYSVGKFARMVYKKYGPVEVEGVDDENVSIGPDGRASKSHYPAGN